MKTYLFPGARPRRRGMAALAALTIFLTAGLQPSALAQPTSVFNYSGRLMQSNAPTGAPPENNTLLSPRHLLSTVPQTTFARKAGTAVTATLAATATRSADDGITKSITFTAAPGRLFFRLVR